VEKISQIVKGNARVSTVDLKDAAPVRPGAPTFGRPVGESTSRRSFAESTAHRAAAIHNELMEKKKAVAQDETVNKLAEQFFMTRIRRPETAEVSAPEFERVDQSLSAREEEETESPFLTEEEEELSRYLPRGSFVDIQA